MATATRSRPAANGNARGKKVGEVALTAAGFPAFEVVPLALCFVDEEYQRPLTAFVARIRERFNPGLVGTFILSYRDSGEYEGKYALVDGQTRWAAMQALGLEYAPALVHRGLAQADEAKLFSDLQYERQNIASYYHFRADLVAKQPEAMAIQKIVEQTGYETGVGGQAINAVVALRAVYRQGAEQGKPGETLERTLTVLREAWSDRIMPNAEMIRGMAWFFRRHEDADDERLARRLSVMTLDDARTRAIAQKQAMGRGSGSAMYMGMALEHIYRGR